MDQRYGVVLGACLTQFTVIGLLFSYGLFFSVFEAEFGWSRTLLSACNAAAFFVMGMLAILGGRLNDRFGPRRVLLASGVIYGLGFVLMSQITAPWQLFLIFSTFLAIGLSTHDVVTLSTVARWFEARRGVMTGVVKVGTATGQVAVPPVAAFALLYWGWRDAVVVLGVGAICLLSLAALSMRAPSVAARDASEKEGVSFAEARRGPVFWRLCAIQGLFFPSLMTVPLHIVVHGQDMGMTPPAAAALLSVIGGASVLGRLGIGAQTDRIGGKRAYVLCLLPLIISLGALVFISTPAPLYAVMALYGFGHGGLFTVVSPTVADYFGMKAHGALFGVILFFGTVGAAIGPIAAGAIFDLTGRYDPAFIGLAAMAMGALFLVLTLPPPWKRRETAGPPPA